MKFQLKHPILLLYLLALAVQPVAAQVEVAPTLVKEYTTKAKANWYKGGWATAITTVPAGTFFVYVDAKLHPKVGQMNNGEVLDLALEDNYTVTDDGHNEFCLAVDREGYIHVLGDMHHNSLRYWVSKNPRTISGGFQRRFEAIPGEFSYYQFIKDPKGDLYMLARTDAVKPWWIKGGGGVGVGFYRYSTGDKTWTSSGKPAPHPQATSPVIFWSATTNWMEDRNYQRFKADMLFDRKGRLHFTVQLNDHGSTFTDNYVIYACSDDGGLTFQRADGTPLALPINLAVEAGRPDVLEGGPNTVLADRSYLLIDAANRPGVCYFCDDSFWLRYWNGTKWMERRKLLPNPFPTLSTPHGVSSACRATTLSDKNGVMTLTMQGRLLRLTAFDSVPSEIELTPHIQRWDRGAPDLDQRFRGIEWDIQSGNFTLYRLDWPPPPPSPPKNASLE